jgi:hypothetical protein
MAHFLYFAQEFSLQKQLVMLLRNVLEFLCQFELFVLALEQSLQTFRNRAVSFL